MSQSVPQQRTLAEAARGDAPSTPHADRPHADFPQHAAPRAAHSPIEREIERSERASAALAAARALARASFTDSELAADDEAQAAEGDIDRPGWVRTEYAGLDQSVRSPQEQVPHGGAPRNLVGGSFNPGIDNPPARPYAAAPMAHSPIETRAGAQARFLHESRHAPRGERPGAPVPSRLDLSAGGGAGHYDKPAVMPMLATPAAAPAARASTGAAARGRAGSGSASGGAMKFAFGAGIGVVAVLVAGGLAWQAGWLSHNTPSNPAIITAQVAAQAEAARLLAAPPQQEIAVAPAAGTPVHRTDAEVDAALAAAARAAAVPVASVQAAGPARAIPPAPVPVSATSVAAAPAHVASTAAPPHTAQQAKEGVAAAIAKAQARADSFLSSGAPAPSAETTASPAEFRPAP